MEQIGTKGLNFLIMIILARLLEPKDFGLLVLVSIFITIAGLLTQSGFNTALIQKKNADEIDFSSVFFLNTFFSSILYVLLFFTAPLLSTFFKESQLTVVLRILSLTLFIYPFSSVQNAVIARNMEFKKLFFSTFGAVIISGLVSIAMAYASFGVWALVGQQFINQLMVTIILWFTVKWRPKFIFSMGRIKSLFSFGWKIAASWLLDSLSINIQNLFVGKLFSPAILGLYNRGEQFPNLFVNNIDGAIQSVMLPTLSSYQDDKLRVKEIIRRTIATSSFIIFPLMVGLATIAEPLVKLLLTEKWLPSVPFLQIFCASYALRPIHSSNLQAMNALGRSDLFLKLEIIKVVLSLCIFGLSMHFGIYGIVWGVFVGNVLSIFINAYPNKKLINYSYKEQWKDINSTLLISLMMGAIVYTVNWLGFSSFLTVIIQIFTGIAIYFGLAILFKLECYNYLLFNLKEMIKRKTKKESIKKFQYRM